MYFGLLGFTGKSAIVVPSHSSHRAFQLLYGKRAVQTFSLKKKNKKTTGIVSVFMSSDGAVPVLCCIILYCAQTLR